MDNGPPIEKLKSVCKIEISIRQRFLALFFPPTEFLCRTYHLYPQFAITTVATRNLGWE